MSTAIIENIALNIVSCVNAVTTANGFAQDLVGVRPRRIDWWNESPVDGNVMVIQDDPEEVDDPAMAGQEWRVNFYLMAIVIDSDRAANSIQSRYNQVWNDLVKRLCDDSVYAATTKRGGYAIDTKPLPPVQFAEGDAGFSGIACNFQVYYRHKYGDPATAA